MTDGSRERGKIPSLGMALCVCLSLGSACAHVPRVVAPPPVDRSLSADASPELAFLVGQELIAEGRVEDALAAYERAIEADPSDAYLLRRAAELAGRQNRIEAAVGYAERAFELDPDHDGLRVFLATTYRLTERPDDAKRVLVGGDGRPVNADAAVLLYGLLSDQGENAEAVEVARHLIELEPDGLRGYYALADLHDRNDDVDAAEGVLRDALLRHPGELQIYGALARLFRDRDLHGREAAVYEEILDQRPDHPSTLLALGEAQMELGDREGAAEVLARVAELDVEDFRIVLRLGFLFFEQRDYAAAVEQFERVLDENPEQHEVTYFAGVSYRRMKRHEEAESLFERIPESSERYAEARTQIASIYEARGEYETALAYVDEARAIQPTRPLDLYTASLRAKSGDFDGAVAFLDRLLEEAPEDIDLLYNLGVLHGEADRDQRAMDYMEDVLAREPDHAGALNFVGYTWAEQGKNLVLAEEYITRALEKRPEDGFITDSLGWLYYQKALPLIEGGQREDGLVWLERAKEQLERAAELTGGDPVIAEHLGDVFLLMGDRQTALEHYQEAIDLVPRDSEQPQLRDKHRKLLEELGQP